MEGKSGEGDVGCGRRNWAGQRLTCNETNWVDLLAQYPGPDGPWYCRTCELAKNPPNHWIPRGDLSSRSRVLFPLSLFQDKKFIIVFARVLLNYLS